METKHWAIKVLLLIIAVFLGILVVRPYLTPETRVVAADLAKYEHVQIVSAGYLYQGKQGILAWDKRNGNVWFIAKGDGMAISFRDPVFVVRLPLEKLDDAPR